MSDTIRLNNPKLKDQIEVTNCPKCGAPLLSEVCQYCGTYVGEVATGDLAAEYPLVRCKLASFSFFGTAFPLIFATAFLGGALLTIANVSMTMDLFEGEAPTFLLFMIPFLLIGLGALFILIMNVWRVISNSIYGKVLEGTVYGYMDDTIAYNGVNGQQVKLLVNTSEGYKFILLPLATTSKPYAVNSKLTVSVYKNTARIISKKNNYNW